MRNYAVLLVMVFGSWLFAGCSDDIVQPETTGTLILQSTPSGATYLIDPPNLSGTTPDTIAGIEASDYQVRFEKNGYIARDTTATILSGRTVVIVVDLDSSLGWLNVTSSPSGAEVTTESRDGVKATPYADSLPPGTYTLHVTRYGYHSQSRNVTVEEAQMTDAHFELVKITGTVYVESNPSGAEVSFDGIATGQTTPMSMRLEPGLHSVRVEHSGYQRFDTTIAVIEGTSHYVVATLIPE